MSSDSVARDGVALSVDRVVALPAQPSRGATVLALQASALAQQRAGAAATAVVNELALRLNCRRVSIGFFQRNGMRVEAMSNTSDVHGDQNIVRAIAAAMNEAVEHDSAVVHPLPHRRSASRLPAHAELARANGGASICSVPIAGLERSLGAFTFERDDAFDAQAVKAATDAAVFVGPILELQHRLDRPLSARLLDAVTRRGSPAGRLGLGGWPLAWAAVVLGLGGLAVWPTTWRVVAPARVEGAGQRIVAAPVDGFVQAATLRPGAVVKAGQVLVTLETGELSLERDKWLAETAQLDKKYRDALTTDDAGAIVMARSRLEQAEAELGLVQRQFERSRITAPFDGVLISGDLTQSIGMPVKRGQELMAVAPDQSFRIVADVDEQDIGVLRIGQRAHVLFGAFEAPLAVALTRIAPVATVLDGRNVFEVDGSVDAPAAVLRPGLRGVARIDIEARSLGSVWWHRASQWLRRTLWRVLG